MLFFKNLKKKVSPFISVQLLNLIFAPSFILHRKESGDSPLKKIAPVAKKY